MITDFVSVTQLQRHPNDVFDSKKPFQIVLSNNQMKGLLISGELANHLLKSDAFDELIDELETHLLHDDETLDLIKRSRAGKGKRISLEAFRKKYDI